MIRLNDLALPVILTSSLVTVSLAYYFIQKNTKKSFEHVARVHQLVIHPIKSCRGVQVDHLRVTRTGVQYGQFRDRAWVVLDANNQFLNLKAAPRLVLIETSFQGDNVLVLNAPGTWDGQFECIKITLKDKISPGDRIIDANVGGADIKGIDCGDQVSAWLSLFLEMPGIRLVQYVDEFAPRQTKSEGKRDSTTEQKYPVMYQNYSNVHLTSISSLDDLNGSITVNSGLDQRITTDHFRPNIVVNESVAWDEDSWLYAKIGAEVDLFQVMNCGRCLQTSVGRDTAVRNTEPIFTLRK